MSLALMHPPGAYNSRAPYQQAIGSMRRAPVLMRPIVGKRAASVDRGAEPSKKETHGKTSDHAWQRDACERVTL